MPLVTLKFKESIIARYPLERGRSLTIGRRKDNDIVIDNLAVSAHHAKIDSVGDAFVLVDLQSKNGSFVNEQIISSHWLKPGDAISIGKHLLLFGSEDDPNAAEAPAREIDRTMVMDTSTYRSMVSKSAPVVPQPLLRRSDAAGSFAYLSGGRGTLALTGSLIKIGKDPASEIVVKGFGVGWTAATVSRRPDGYYLSRVGGLVKPRVNGRKVKTSQRLQDLDVIDIGSVKLQFFLQNDANSRPA
jgi:pSer/pThr/pTyr-binding forkhead associated (FHA) protein